MEQKEAGFASVDLSFINRESAAKRNTGTATRGITKSSIESALRNGFVRSRANTPPVPHSFRKRSDSVSPSRKLHHQVIHSALVPT